MLAFSLFLPHPPYFCAHLHSLYSVVKRALKSDNAIPMKTFIRLSEELFHNIWFFEQTVTCCIAKGLDMSNRLYRKSNCTSRKKCSNKVNEKYFSDSGKSYNLKKKKKRVGQKTYDNWSPAPCPGLMLPLEYFTLQVLWSSMGFYF